MLCCSKYLNLFFNQHRFALCFRIGALLHVPQCKLIARRRSEGLLRGFCANPVRPRLHRSNDHILIFFRTLTFAVIFLLCLILRLVLQDFIDFHENIYVIVFQIIYLVSTCLTIENSVVSKLFYKKHCHLFKTGYERLPYTKFGVDGVIISIAYPAVLDFTIL